MPDSPEDLRTEVRTTSASSPSTPRFTAGQVVAGRYRIVAPLGRGGMGEVFRAEDIRLGQHVALKFLPAEIAADSRAIDMLAAEVRIARGVSHPNVCRVYDLVESDGLCFIAMEFVDGEDLASLLRRIGRLTGEKAVALAQEICAGLAAAHDAGVVHRDLKPANVMIDGRGRARITDFGLAIARGDLRSRDIAGTPAYMAPEQFSGEPANVRSDLYALGALLFEMFTGQRLFDASSIDEVRELHGRPKPLLSSLVPDADPALERVILDCLEEEPQRRPARATEVMEKMPASAAKTPRPAMTPRSSGRQTPGSSRSERSIAVLPFEDLSPGADDESFSAGLAEEIISDLSKIGALRVISRGSVMRFRGARDLVSVARELQVTYLLSGSVRKSGEQLRLTANLVDGRNDEIVWSEKFKGSVDDVFDIQESVARTVAEQLKVKLTAEESARIAERPIPNAVAYEYYLRARNEIWKFNSEGLAIALQQLQRGLEAVGENALIYSAMALAEWQYFNSGIDPDDRHLERAEELVRKVFAIEPDSVHGHRMLGLIATTRGDTREGILRLRRAVADDPSDTEAAAWLCLLYAFSGCDDAARLLAARLETIDPFGLLGIAVRALSALVSGNVAEGLAVVRAGRAFVPQWAPLLYYEGSLNAMAGRREEAAALFRRGAGSPDFVGRLCRFLADAMSGDRAAAFESLQHIEEGARHDLQYAVDAALGLAASGETDRVFEWLEIGLSRGFFAWRYVAELHPVFQPLRQHPRLVAITTRMRAASEALRSELAGQ